MSFKMAVLFVGACVLQWWWSTYLCVWGLAPQVLLVLTVALACRVSAPAAMGTAFAWGLFWDLLDAQLFGANALILTLIAYACARVRKQVDVTSLPSQCFLVLVMSVGHFLLKGVLGAVFLKSFLWPGWAVFVALPAYNCAAAVAAAAAFETWGRR